MPAGQRIGLFPGPIIGRIDPNPKWPVWLAPLEAQPYVPPAPAFVQAAHNGTGSASASTIAQALTNPVGTGNTVFVVVGFNFPTVESPGPSVTDDKGNTYTQIEAIADGINEPLYVLYCPNVTNAPQTITATMPGGIFRSFRRIIVWEYSGLAAAPLDAHNSIYRSAGSTTPSTQSATPTQNGELIIGIIADPSTGSQTVAPTSPFTWRVADNGYNVIDTVQATAGAISASGTWGSSLPSLDVIITLKAAVVPVVNTDAATIGGVTSVPSVNVIVNPSFEIDTSNWIRNGATTAFVRVTDDQLFGAAALEITTHAADGINTGVEYIHPSFSAISVVPGEVVSFSFYAKARPGYGGTKVNAQINQNDATNTTLQAYSAGSDVTLSETVWQRVFWSGTIVAGAALAQPYINISDSYGSGLDSVWLIDGVQFEFAPAPTAYVDYNGPPIEIHEISDFVTVAGITTPSSVETHAIPDSATIASTTAFSITDIYLPGPSGILLDAFTRTNQSPPGGNWLGSNGGFQVSGNTLIKSGSTDDDMYYNSTPQVDTDVWVTIGGSSFPAGEILRLYARTSTDFLNGYYVELNDTNSLTIYKRVAGVNTQLGSTFGAPAGDTLGLTVRGSQIGIWVRNAGVWSLIGFVTDSAITAAGVTGLETTGAWTPTLDDYSGNVSTALLDSATLSTKTTPSTSDITAFVEAATATSITTPSSVEVHEIPDAATIASKTTPSTTDVAAFIEAGILATVTQVSSVEAHIISDANTVAGVTTPATSDIAALVDSATCAGVTSISATELHEIPDSATIAGNTAPSASDVAAFTEAATDSSITSVSATEVHEISDAATIAGVTTPGGSDVYTAGGVAYTEAATVAGVTSVSQVEIHEIPDSATVSSKTTPISVEIAAYTDANTISGATSVSTTETTQDVDANTGTTTTTVTSSDIATLVDSALLATKTVPSTTDLAAYADTATVASTTQPSTVELHEIPDSATVTGTTAPSATDVAAYVDGVTISNASNVTSTDLPAYTEVGTPTSVTSITTVDVAAFVDGTIASGVTTPSSSEQILHGNQDTDTFTSTTSPSAVEVTAYVDAQTIASVTNLSSVEIAPSDANTISGVSNVSATEVAAFVDTATITATTTPSSIELPSLSDTATISGTTTFSGTDLAAYVDSGTVVSNSVGTAGDIGAYTDSALAAGITTLLSDEQLLHGNQEASTVPIVTALTYTEVAAYAETSTIATNSNVSAIESRDIPDANTVSGTSVLSSIEQAQYVDTATNTSVTTLVAVEVREIGDASTINGTTTLTSIEVVPGTDSNTIVGITTPSSTEVHEISDANTVTVITNPSAVEVVVVVDTGPLLSTTTISSTDLAAYTDTQVISSVTTPSGVEGNTSGKTDADTVSSTITLSAAIEVVAFVDQNTISGKTGVTSSEGGYVDSNTISIYTSPVASDIALTTDSSSINSITSLSTVEQATNTDNGIVSNNSTLIYSDVSAYLESSTIIGTTSYSGTELSGVDYSEAITIPSQTRVNYVEQAIYVETSTLVTRTSLTDLQVTVYTDATAITSYTTVESLEFAKAPSFDSATISSVTIPGFVFEYAVKLSELVVVSYYIRWQSTSTSLRWAIPVRSFVRWGAKPLQSRFAEKVSRKWAAWTH